MPHRTMCCSARADIHSNYHLDTPMNIFWCQIWSKKKWQVQDRVTPVLQYEPYREIHTTMTYSTIYCAIYCKMRPWFSNIFLGWGGGNYTTDYKIHPWFSNRFFRKKVYTGWSKSLYTWWLQYNHQVHTDFLITLYITIRITNITA
jgi:hypothetical protein